MAFLTENDLRRIAKYLADNGIKDSSFLEYHSDLSGNEYTVISSGITNYKIPIKKLWNNVSFNWNNIKDKPLWITDNKPTYTYSEVGALSEDTFIPTKTSDIQNDRGYLTENNFKTINGIKIVGAGDITIRGEGIAEAPSDGRIYGRQNGTWIEVTGGSGNSSNVNITEIFNRINTAFESQTSISTDDYNILKNNIGRGNILFINSADKTTLIDYNYSNNNIYLSYNIYKEDNTYKVITIIINNDTKLVDIIENNIKEEILELPPFPDNLFNYIILGTTITEEQVVECSNLFKTYLDTHYNSSFQDFYDILPNKVSMSIVGTHLILNVSKFNPGDIQEIHLYAKDTYSNIEISIYKSKDVLFVNGIPFITRGYLGQGTDMLYSSKGSTILNVIPNTETAYPMGTATNLFCTVGGIGTVAHHKCEVALGKFNYSYKGTQENTTPEKATVYSYGIGTSNEDRKNAFEIKENGDIYILGVGEYTGSNFETSSTIQDILNKVDTIIINMNADASVGTFTLPPEELAKVKTITNNSNVKIIIPSSGGPISCVPINQSVTTTHYNFIIVTNLFTALLVITGTINLETGVCGLTIMQAALTEIKGSNI